MAGRGRAATGLVVALFALVVLSAPSHAQSMRETVYEKLSRAESLAGEKEFEKALEELKDVEDMRDLSPYERAHLYTAYGFLHVSREEYRAAIAAYENVLAQPELPKGLESGTLYTIAQLQFQVEDYGKAIEFLTRWLAATPDPGPEAHFLLAQAHYQQEEYEAAVPAVEKAIEIAEAHGRRVEENWYLLLRVLHYELESFPQVVEILELLVQRYPKKDYWLQLAGMYGELEREEKQLNAYEIAYTLGYLDTEATLVLLAQLLLQADVPYRAGAVLAKAMDEGIVEGRAEHWRLLSQAWTVAQENERAIEALTRAAALTADGELDARLAQSHLNRGQLEEAVATGGTALEKGVQDENDVRVLLGMALWELDRAEEAKAEFRRAMSSPESRRTASSWLRYIEKEEKRLSELRRALGAASRGDREP